MKVLILVLSILSMLCLGAPGGVFDANFTMLGCSNLERKYINNTIFTAQLIFSHAKSGNLSKHGHRHTHSLKKLIHDLREKSNKDTFTSIFETNMPQLTFLCLRQDAYIQALCDDHDKAFVKIRPGVLAFCGTHGHIFDDFTIVKPIAHELVELAEAATMLPKIRNLLTKIEQRQNTSLKMLGEIKNLLNEIRDTLNVVKGLLI